MHNLKKSFMKKMKDKVRFGYLKVFRNILQLNKEQFD